jgi:putative ABC transport system permease protein
MPYSRLVSLGAMVVAAAFVTLSLNLRLPNAQSKTAWIMFGHALLIFGTALLSAPYIAVWSRVLAPLGPRSGLPVELACEFFARRPRRIAAAASAIMVGYALVIVLGAVVLSITDTLGQWINQTFGADLSIGMPPGLTSGSFDSAIANKARELPGVATVERYRKGLFIYDGQPVVLAAVDGANRPDHEPLILVRSTKDAYGSLASGRAAFISDSFAFRYRLDIGDRITLDSPTGRHSFAIAGVARDYTMDIGTILLDIKTYQEWWRDDRLTYAHIWPTPGTELRKLRDGVSELIRDSPAVTVATNAEFRKEIDDRIRDLLKLLGSLQIFACAISVLGVVTFLLSAVVDRRREIALLRSVGVTAHQIQGAMMLEGGLIAVAGAFLGLLAGLPAAYFMVTHSLVVAMGWSLTFRFPAQLAVTTLVAIAIAATLAAYFPARRITRGTILAGLQME